MLTFEFNVSMHLPIFYPTAGGKASLSFWLRRFDVLFSALNVTTGNIIQTKVWLFTISLYYTDEMLDPSIKIV